MQLYLRHHLLNDAYQKWPSIEVITSPILDQSAKSTSFSRTSASLKALDRGNMPKSNDHTTRSMLHIDHATLDEHQSIMVLSEATDDFIAMMVFYWDRFQSQGLTVCHTTYYFMNSLHISYSTVNLIIHVSLWLGIQYWVRLHYEAN